uniref:DNA 5'-3' helicase n=1 Tax=Polysiphonia elongata TaxID=159753 RepID=A0A1Z1MC10_9FLOR|nr:Replication helicase subunit [Polysiphonia elongata]ARW63402.1 Replication helicase subunit [Polysiphonia elongata]
MQKFYRYKFIPQNYLAEEILIGIILIYPKILNKTKEFIKTDIFFVEIHKTLYSKLISIINSKDTNVLKLLYEIEKINTNSQASYIDHMIKLMKKSHTFISCCKTNNYLENLIKLLRKAYTKRLIIQLGYNIIKLGYVINIKSNYLYTKITSYIQNIEENIKNNRSSEITNIKEFVSKQMLGIKYISPEKIHESKKTKITSGLISLDRIINCLPAGNLIIIAGRPSIGKTSLSINIAYNCFLKNQISLLIFSLEMTSSQIFNKFIKIGSENTIEQEPIETISHKNWEKISKICHLLLKQNIYVNEEPKLNINQIEFIANNLRKNQFIELIIIDYLQLVELGLNEKVHNNRSQEVGYITRRLKLLAQYLKIPIVAISQLNRNIENRQQKEPLLSDLKESGCILYNHNIHIYKKELNVANKNLQEIGFTNNIFILNHFVLKNKYNINILHKYIFKSITKKINIGLTYNHKCLTKINWIKLSQVSRVTQILHNIDYSIKIRKYFKKIKFDKHSKTYDLNAYDYFNLLTKTTIVHNSIEQDADIIMILYEADSTQYNSQVTTNKIIDLKVSKNRNGSTGNCKLNFEPYKNKFKDLLIEQ